VSSHIYSKEIRKAWGKDSLKYSESPIDDFSQSILVEKSSRSPIDDFSQNCSDEREPRNKKTQAAENRRACV